MDTHANDQYVHFTDHKHLLAGLPTGVLLSLWDGLPGKQWRRTPKLNLSANLANLLVFT
jgi:hypothetical protein